MAIVASINCYKIPWAFHFDAVGVANSTETFDNSSDNFVNGPNMTDSRQGHTATFLNGFVNGPAAVLIAGG